MYGYYNFAGKIPPDYHPDTPVHHLSKKKLYMYGETYTQEKTKCKYTLYS